MSMWLVHFFTLSHSKRMDGAREGAAALMRGVTLEILLRPHLCPTLSGVLVKLLLPHVLMLWLHALNMQLCQMRAKRSLPAAPYLCSQQGDNAPLLPHIQTFTVDWGSQDGASVQSWGIGLLPAVCMCVKSLCGSCLHISSVSSLHC